MTRPVPRAPRRWLLAALLAWVWAASSAGAALFDIRPGPLGGVELNAPHALIDETLYIVANDGTTGIELWKSGGAGAFLVKNINTVGLHSRPLRLTVVGSQLFFQADDGVHGVELWVSDGTESGTQLVRDIILGSGDANPVNLVDWNGTLWFTVGTTLWKSDGTEVGTEQVWQGPGNFGDGGFAPVGDQLFFTFDDVAALERHGEELWVTDGTGAGTTLVKDINPGSSGSQPYALTAFKDMLVFAATDPVANTEPWKSDGTEGGTLIIRDINQGAGFSLSAIPSPDFTQVGGDLYFAASNGVDGRELWKTTGVGAQLVNDINQGAGHSNPSELTAGSTLFFRARGFLVPTDETDPRDFGNELWTPGDMVDGRDFPNHGTWSPINLIPYGGGVLFAAQGEIEKVPGNPEMGYDQVGNELWSAGSTSARLVEDIMPGIAGSDPEPFGVVRGALFFSAITTDNGRELFYLDVAPPAVTNVSVAPNPAGGNIDVTITATADDTGRGDTPIQSARYRVNGQTFPEEGVLDAVDGMFDDVREDLVTTLPGISLEAGDLEVCVAAMDDARNESSFECVDLTVEDDPPDLLVRCTHSPIWPQPGDTVTIRAETFDGLDGSGNPIQGALTTKSVDTIEIWVGASDAPDDVQTGAVQDVTFDAGTFDLPFFYGCRAIDDANGSDEAVFSGWRVGAVGPSGLYRPVPLIFNRAPSHAVDIAFIPDEDGYTSPTDPTFLSDVADGIRLGFYGQGLFLRNQHLLNLWLARDTGNAKRGDVFEDACDHEVPDNWDDDYGFIDSGAIFHTDCMRDCAFDRVFSVEGNSVPQCPTGGLPLQVLRHEAGHRPFGLADEYCCDGGYYQKGSFPNLYEELEDCIADAPNLGRTAADCREFEAEVDWWFDSDWSISEPASGDLMSDNGVPQAADIRRIQGLFDFCERGLCGGILNVLERARSRTPRRVSRGIPEDPTTEPMPELVAADQQLAVAVEMQFNSRTDVVPLSARVTTTDAHMHLGDPPLLRVECMDAGGGTMGEFNAWHPLWVHDEGPDGAEGLVIRDSAVSTVIVPFHPDLADVRLTDVALAQELVTVDVESVVQEFCDANPMAPACSVPTTTTTTTVASSSTTVTTVSTTTSTTLPTELLSGKKLLLADKPGKPAKRKLVMLAKDGAVTLGAGNGSADDPVVHGGSLRVRSDSGGFDTLYPLDGGWKYLKKEGANKGYKFKGGSPVKTVLVKPGKLIRIVAKGEGLGHDLTADPNPVYVTLTLGQRRYCMTFGGTTTFRDGRRYLAKGAGTAAGCGP